MDILCFYCSRNSNHSQYWWSNSLQVFYLDSISFKILKFSKDLLRNFHCSTEYSGCIICLQVNLFQAIISLGKKLKSFCGILHYPIIFRIPNQRSNSTKLRLPNCTYRMLCQNHKQLGSSFQRIGQYGTNTQ